MSFILRHNFSIIGAGENMRILFVCLGNICRSPAAEAVFEKLVCDAGLENRIEIDSAGTGGWHIGEQADPRMRSAARELGFKITSRGRQVTNTDFQNFDLIIAMDSSNFIRYFPCKLRTTVPNLFNSRAYDNSTYRGCPRPILWGSRRIQRGIEYTSGRLQRIVK